MNPRVVWLPRANTELHYLRIANLTLFSQVSNIMPFFCTLCYKALKNGQKEFSAALKSSKKCDGGEEFDDESTNQC